MNDEFSREILPLNEDDHLYETDEDDYNKWLRIKILQDRMS